MFGVQNVSVALAQKAGYSDISHTPLWHRLRCGV